MVSTSNGLDGIRCSAGAASLAALETAAPAVESASDHPDRPAVQRPSSRGGLAVLLLLASLALLQAAILALEPVLGHYAGHILAFANLGLGTSLLLFVAWRALSTAGLSIERQRAELATVQAIAAALATTPDIRSPAPAVLQAVLSETRSRAAELVALSEDASQPPATFSLGSPQALSWLAAVRASEDARPGARAGAHVAPTSQLPPPIAEAATALGLRTYAYIPLVDSAKPVGVLRLVAGDGGRFDSTAERLLQSIGSQVAAAVRTRQALQGVLDRLDEAEALYQTGLEIASLSTVREIQERAVRGVRAIVGSDAAALCLANEDRSSLTLASISGPVDAFRQARGDVTFSGPATAGTPERFLWLRPGSRCPAVGDEYCVHHVSAPVLAGAVLIGHLCAASCGAEPPTEREQTLLTGLANVTAIALANARLRESEHHRAVREERERLAREMHDGVAQVLGYLHLKAQATRLALAQPAGPNIGKAQAELEDIAERAREGYVDVRETILGLRETISPAVGFTGTIRQYLRKLSQQSGFEVDLQTSKTPLPALAPNAEQQLLRVVQEALTNARKHSGLDRARVRLEKQPGEVLIVVEDDGKGFDPAGVEREDSRSFGLKIMRERVEKAGGRLEIESTPGEGTRVRVRIAVSQGEET